MHKTIYIDADEEITSIIEKIEIEESREIFLVVPKDAMLVQGVVNLKLLKKEAEKLGKKIVLVTSDKYAKRVIKSVGFQTKDKTSQDFSSQQEKPVPAKKAKIKEEEAPSRQSEEDEKKPAKRTIGSPNFFDGDPDDNEDIEEDRAGETSPSEEEERPAGQRSPSARNASFSKRRTRKLPVRGGFIADKEEEKERERNEESRRRNREETEHSESLSQTENSEAHLFNKKPEKREAGTGKTEFIDESKLESFYNGHENSSGRMNNRGSLFSKNNRKDKHSKPSAASLLYGIGGLVLLAVFSFAGYWLYFKLPRVDIEIHPRFKEASGKLELKAKEAGAVSSSDKAVIQGHLNDFEVTQSQTFQATGEKFSSDKGKARGRVKIYNRYSGQNQPLVATTRVLSEEGKLFRLTEGVTVPGMKGEEPGVVEAKVIADEPGDEYNIEPSKFTIEGFKGGPKYEKFEVESEQKMQGGEESVENQKVKAVTEQDIDKAREETVDKLKSSLASKIRSKAGQGMIFLEGSAEKEIIENTSSHQAGDIAQEFEYTVKEKVKIITFSENELNEQIKKSLGAKMEEGYAFDKIIEIEYVKDIADYENKELDLTVEARAAYRPLIEKEKIKSELNGEKSEEIKQYLSTLDKIEKAVITYDPAWLSSFSVRKENISIRGRQ
ncbi:MAG: hypothetical protein U5L10_02000 [Candidatus Moranbacteria bacterium]|nr:hypothetical protein [Candidatus Moranbacteria bacterium]